MPQAPGLCLAERDLLQDLADHSDPPKDLEIAAELLRKWMLIRLRDKPIAHCVSTWDAVGFLAWLLRETGDGPYKLVKARHPEEAAEIRRQILALCFWTANTCFRMSGPCYVPLLGIKHAEACLEFPEHALGPQDAIF